MAIARVRVYRTREALGARATSVVQARQENNRVGLFTRTWRIFTRKLCQLSVEYLTGPTIAKKMRLMKQIRRRICCAPMMDWTNRLETSR